MCITNRNRFKPSAIIIYNTEGSEGPVESRAGNATIPVIGMSFVKGYILAQEDQPVLFLDVITWFPSFTQFQG